MADQLGSKQQTMWDAPSMIERGADFSPCRIYRYTLWRRWGPGDRICWLLLNPSTADANHDDPTNRRGIGFSKAWGFESCVFVNLFAYRATNPKDMKAASDPVGPENDEHIYQQTILADKVVIAWGNDGSHRRRDLTVIHNLLALHTPLFCLGMTKQHQPKHPLYLRKDTEWRAWVNG